MDEGSGAAEMDVIWRAVPRLVRLAVTLVLALVFVRLLHLQLVVAPVVIQPESPLDIRTRTIPATRGEIVTHDGVTLARTRVRTVVAVHYRVLERPLDRRWLERWFRDRYPELSPKQRIEAAAKEVARLIPALAELTGVPEHVLQARAAHIRRRVTRVKQAVARRLGLSKADSPAHYRPGGLFGSLLRLLSEPEPRLPDPLESLVIKEETWYYPLVAIEDRNTAARLLAHLEELPGVRIEQQLQREYPQGRLACHILGYVARRQGDELGPFAGVSGVEAYYQEVLEGERGEVREQRQPDGSWEVLSGSFPRDGNRIVLTIDRSLQHGAELALAETCTRGLESPTGGAVIVLEAATGAIRAAASYPTFEPGNLSNGGTARLAGLGDSGGAPLLARFHQAALPPGSLFKLVVALAALDAGVLQVGEPIECRGYFGADPNHHRCWIYAEHGRTHGPLTLPEAIAQSCNYYFFELGMRLGPGRIASMGELLGVGRRSGIDLPNEKPGRLPRLVAGEGGAIPVDLLNMSIGQGDLQVTPVQAARWTAAIATGYLVRPHVWSQAFAPRMRLPVSSEAREAVLEGMRLAVERPWGTAHAQLGDLPLPVRAKTGTAESGSGKPHSWCAAVLGEGERALVVVALIEHGGKGGDRAAFLVRRVARLLEPATTAAQPGRHPVQR